MPGLIESHVRDTDAFTLSMERDPLLRSTIVAVAVFDRSPDWDTFVERVDRATRLTPTFRQRLEPTPLGLAPPRWVTDPDFDLDFHLRRVAAPAPRTLQTVHELARNTGMAAFDPARPLWEFTLVEGLTDDRAALVMKVHHSLTDGIGGIQIAAHVVDFQREATELGPMPPAPAPARPTVFDAWRDALAYDAVRLARLARTRGGALPQDAWNALRSPVQTVGDAIATIASLARFVRPVTSTLSPVMTARRLQWHYDTLDVPLAPLKQAAKRADATLNDAFLAGVTGGLDRYHRRHGSSVPTLRVTMPISIRQEDDPEGGNRITLVRFEVPVDLDDPVERMRALDRTCADRRQERALPYSNAVAAVLNLLPNAITGGMLKHVDFLASNVPGFPDAVFVGGAELTGFYAFGPTIGAAANITLMSYRDTCSIGVNTDAGAVPDPDEFLACLLEGFEEIVDLAGTHEPVIAHRA